MKILFLEPFYGGSHERVAKGFAAASRHQVEILGLAPRFWKWRMRGAALWFARQIRAIRDYDIILATDMMDLTDFKALVGTACPPVVLYFHENQLSYPLSPGEKRDFHLGFTNLVSAVAADLVLFNSKFHRDGFFTAGRGLIRKMPDARPSWMMDEIEAKTRILYPGFNLPEAAGGAERGNRPGQSGQGTDPALVIWNHRWEYDKDPETFFRVMDRLADKGIAFELAVLGEKYETAPEIFTWARDRFRDRIRVWGYQSSVEDYRAWLSRGDFVVSTAIQENFGISVMEAVAHGCFPLLPDRLSYPELIPKAFRKDVIYQGQRGLEAKLEALLLAPGNVAAACHDLCRYARSFSWHKIILEWDGMLEDLRQGQNQRG